MRKWFTILRFSPGLQLVQALAALGPFMLALALMATSLYPIFIPMSWLIGALLWPATAFLYRWKGFALAGVVVASFFVGNYPEGMNALYSLALFASFGLSALTLILVQDFNGILFGNLEKKALESQDLIENLKGALSEMEFSYEQLRQKNSEELEALEEKYQKQFQEQVNLLKVDKQRLQILSDTLKEEAEKKDKQLTFVKSVIREYVSEKMTTPDLFAKPAEDEIENHTELKNLYRQLKEQFEEKANALKDSRKELFLIETKLLTLQKENEIRDLDLSGSELTLIHQMIHLEKEKDELELQIKHLEELVTELLQAHNELKSHAMLP